MVAGRAVSADRVTAGRPAALVPAEVRAQESSQGLAVQGLAPECPVRDSCSDHPSASSTDSRSSSGAVSCSMMVPL